MRVKLQTTIAAIYEATQKQTKRLWRGLVTPVIRFLHKITKRILHKYILPAGKYIAKRFWRMAKKVSLFLHFHVAKRPHNHLMNKFSWYARWHGWQWRRFHHGHVHGAIAAAWVLLVVFFIGSFTGNVSALNSWAQTDWSGGVGASTTNQYASGSNVETSVAGEASISATAGWCNNASCNSSWKYRRKITFDNTTANLGVTSTALTNFPVLVNLNSSRVDYSNTQNSGQDIRFTDTDGSALSYQIEHWDEAGTSNVWVKVPSIDINSSTDYMYMYYGNASASDAQAATSVWDSNFKAVYHLPNGTTLSAADSTSNAVNGTLVNAPPAGAGRIDGGLISGGIIFHNYVDLGTSAHLNTGGPTTVEMWIKPTLGPTGVDRVLFSRLAFTTGYELGILSSANGLFPNVFYFSLQNLGAVKTAVGGTSAAGTWFYLVGTYDGATGRIYINNAQGLTTSGAGAIGSISASAYIAHRGGTSSNDGDGTFDEVRISNVARSSAWIAATYHTQTDDYSTYEAEETLYPATGSLTSNIFPTTIGSAWGNLTFNLSTPAGTTATVKVRSGNSSDLSDATAFGSCSAITSGSDLTGGCTPDNTRYIQYQLDFTSTGTDTPTVQDISIDYSNYDTTPPDTNASSILMTRSNGGASVASNGWTNGSSPYFGWTAGADNVGGEGLKGYCLYLGQSSGGDPVTDKGLLGTSPVDTGGACQFAVSGNSIDTATAGYIGTALSSSSSPYYLNVKAVDLANNVYSGTSDSFHFRFDNTEPANPAFVTAPSQFVSTKNVTMTWDTAGGSAPSDANSGVAGLQYKIGSGGTWYGDSHSGTQDNTDLLTNDGSYTTNDPIDYNVLAEGNNIVYFRTYDTAGNVATANVTAVIKLNTVSPSSPQNVTATPTSNTTNSFAFSWLVPASFTGQASNITYCYTVNTAPTVNNCTFTAAGVVSLSAGAYATQPGDNTFYVVAKDEAGNINYATAATTTFTANTSAPGLPQNVEIADVSTKATSSWKLALSWSPPSDVGAGISSYRVYRSTNNSTFTQITTTAGNSMVDTGLSQVTYYYKIKACDSANNCGADSATVSKLPTGRFTTPANLLVEPKVTSISTRKATITWTTDRASDSRIQFGTSPGQYQATEAASSAQTVSHSIQLNNLTANTTYYFQARWVDEDGNVGVSSEHSFTTLPAPTIKEVHTPSLGLTTALVQFTSKDAVKVKLFYGKTDGFGGLKTINTSASESSYTISLEGLDDGTQYFYKLNPIDSDGNEYDSGRVDTFTTPARPRITNLQHQPVPGEPTSSQKVTWQTNVPATSTVNYGPIGTDGTGATIPQLVTSHEVIIRNLKDDTDYFLAAQSQDANGSVATSDRKVFKTALDTRAPKITDINVETSVRGTGADARGQVVVSWRTDEPATSQVGYTEGSRVTKLVNKTGADNALSSEHIVIVSDLPTSRVYTVAPISKDKSGNEVTGSSQSAIIGRATDSILTLVLNTLRKVFGF